MKRIIVQTFADFNKIPDFNELLPKEYEVGGKLKEQGILENLFIKEGMTGAVMVLKDVDETRAKELVATFPLFKYFEKVEYRIVEKEF